MNVHREICWNGHAMAIGIAQQLANKYNKKISITMKKEQYLKAKQNDEQLQTLHRVYIL